MANILELCKVFSCHINDLVHEDMSDISYLKDIKTEIVKFQTEKQKKMKRVSKIIYTLSNIGKNIMLVFTVLLTLLMISAPFVVNNIHVIDNNIKYKDITIGILENTDISALSTLFENTSKLTLNIYVEITIICLIVSIILIYLTLKQIECLFKNINHGKTPFTIENINYLKAITKYIIISIIFPIVSGFIMELLTNIDLGIEFELMDIILILVIYSITCIFEYGYEIQLDSKGVMYNEE